MMEVNNMVIRHPWSISTWARLEQLAIRSHLTEARHWLCHHVVDSVHDVSRVCAVVIYTATDRFQ
jgi:hypothetical protein